MVYWLADLKCRTTRNGPASLLPPVSNAKTLAPTSKLCPIIT
ncbi:hypothetical protein SLEP1_g41741 [Rubroshorea leprosula]|uniref:Uncharacterized protein n=1 Tax=Rubroshorea leprosula TaxID=152421 RepID=A0AAV5L8H2_9ROSI|nr:hypothetical protein SLEP1_g41741 [Rubroshorea leprosula]